MRFEVGQTVQAVDAEGRWSEGQVESFEDEEKAVISWTGWSCRWNGTVAIERIREPLVIGE